MLVVLPRAQKQQMENTWIRHQKDTSKEGVEAEFIILYVLVYLSSMK